MARREIDQSTINTALDLYRAGKPVAAIARQTQMHAQTVLRYALQAGLTPPQERAAAAAQQRVNRAHELHREGKTVEQIAQLMQKSPRRVRAYLQPTAEQARAERNAAVLRMAEQGHPRANIAAYLGIDPMTVTRIINHQED